MPGILFARNWSLVLPAGSIQIQLDSGGNVYLPPVEPLVMVEFWPEWLTIASRAADDAVQAHVDLVDVGPDGPGEDKARALLCELRHGLLAISACAFVFDGVNDSVRRRLSNPPTFNPLTPTWRRTVAVLQRGFKLPNPAVRALKPPLRTMFTMRNHAVHPAARNEVTFTLDVIDAGVPECFHNYSGRERCGSGVQLP